VPEVASPWAGRYAVARAEFAKIKAALKQIESAPVHAGTAPVPPNWYYKGWGMS
jgi:hypothetical protein